VEASSDRAINIYLLDPDELLERAFSKASEAAEEQNVSGLRPIVKARIKEKTRLRTASSRISGALNKAVKSLPEESQISPFLLELLDTLGGGGLARSRREIQRSLRSIRSITRRSLSKMDRAPTASSLHGIRRAAYGRISGEVRSLGSTFDYLRKLAPRMKELPAIKAGLPTVVIAGYPNVGKTTLLKALTGSAPEIRPIPFTTRSIQLGYYPWRWQRVQVIDTPGLLDRPEEDRNPVERKAVGALRHLPDVVVFIIDPTTTGGYTLDCQLNLLSQVRGSFDKPLLVVISQVDIASTRQLEVADSALEHHRTFHIDGISGSGVEELRGALSSYLIEIAAPVEG
jgi:nucleolar GTP-binding protein